MKMQTVAYQKNQDSWPAFLNPSATESTVPPKSDAVNAYGRPTPSARTLVGNSSALMIAVMDV